MPVKEKIRYGVLVGSFLVAFMASIVPLPIVWAWYRPEWVLLVLIFWCVKLPNKASVGFGWSIGLLQDGLRGALLGQNALAFSLVAYFSVQLHQRFRLFPLWQQSLAVLVMVGVAQLTNFWIEGWVDSPVMNIRYWFASLTSMLMWPVIQLVLSFLLQTRRPAKSK